MYTGFLIPSDVIFSVVTDISDCNMGSLLKSSGFFSEGVGFEANADDTDDAAADAADATDVATDVAADFNMLP